jgi:bifunctional non-homologous end joining protein LigD
VCNCVPATTTTLPPGILLPKLPEPIRYSPELKASLKDLIQSVKAQGLEGLVAKSRDSKYEPGLRSAAWQKTRVNQGQNVVIAGYTPSPKNFDALVIGYYDGGKLIYAKRTRNGFTPASRMQLFKKIKPLETEDCSFANLPEKKAGRWGAGLTAAKMSECRWLKPELVAQFEFVEWTSDNHLRHSRPIKCVNGFIECRLIYAGQLRGRRYDEDPNEQFLVVCSSTWRGGNNADVGTVERAQDLAAMRRGAMAAATFDLHRVGMG